LATSRRDTRQEQAIRYEPAGEYLGADAQEPDGTSRRAGMPATLNQEQAAQRTGVPGREYVEDAEPAYYQREPRE
jgi:hypothetical protein